MMRRNKRLHLIDLTFINFKHLTKLENWKIITITGREYHLSIFITVVHYGSLR